MADDLKFFKSTARGMTHIYRLKNGEQFPERIHGGQEFSITQEEIDLNVRKVPDSNLCAFRNGLYRELLTGSALEEYVRSRGGPTGPTPFKMPDELREAQTAEQYQAALEAELAKLKEGGAPEVDPAAAAIATDGTTEPVYQVPEGVLTDEEIDDILKIRLVGEFTAAIAKIENPVTLGRLLTAGKETGLGTQKQAVIQDRMQALIVTDMKIGPKGTKDGSDPTDLPVPGVMTGSVLPGEEAIYGMESVSLGLTAGGKS